MAYEGLKYFLYRVLPWAPLGDPNSYINIHWTYQRPSYNRPAWAGRACVSIDECVQNVEWARKLADTKDFYVCMSTQRECDEVRKAASGRVTRRAKREGTNAVQLRTLFADIDVKGAHANGYATQADALKAVLAFCKESGIPRPTLFVQTGSGGIHCYWTLNEALPVNVWQPLANALAEAARRYNLKIDGQVTVDSVRVMRLPDTIHSKTKQLATIDIKHALAYDYTVDQMRHALAPYMGAQVIQLTPKGNAQVGELGAGIETPKAPPVAIETVADAGCGFIRDALATGGAVYPNPLWNLTTLCAVFTEGGRDDAHRMASGHPTYSREDTDELFDRKLREKETKNLGWPSCQSVENAGCTSCAGCPLKGPGTKPLQFGRPTPARQPTTPDAEADIPAGYTRNKDDIVSKLMFDKSGNPYNEKVIDYGLFEPWVQTNPWTLHFKARIGSSVEAVHVTIAQANSPEGFGKALGNQGIAIPAEKEKAALFRGFIVAWTRRMQEMKDAVISAAPFGWSVEHGKVVGFCFNGRVWRKDGDKPSAPPNPVMAHQYTPKGRLQPWIDAAKMVTDLGSPERNAILAAAFAGPLVRFTGQNGFLISAFSIDSGVGKTTAMRTAQAVWGDPHRGMQGMSDSTVSVLGKIGALQHLPLFWDEIKTEENTTRFVNIAFELTGGREKSRMNSDATLRESGVWQTLLMSACNDSLLDHIVRMTKGTTAGLFRVFEYTVEPVKTTLSAGQADQLVLALNDNYGLAGERYAQFLGQNHERVHKEVADMRAYLDKKTNAGNDERFWICAIAVLFLGARYANELKLTQIDEGQLLKFLLNTLTKLRSELTQKPVDMSNTLSLSSVLGQYINEKRARHLLLTDRVHTSPGKPPPNSVKVIADASKLDEITIHIGRDSKIMRLLSTPFRTWLADHGYSPHNICQRLEKLFGAKQVHGRIGGGSPFAVATTQYMIEFDLTDPELTKFLDV